MAEIITVGYDFFDEWHKQFIGGRHFQLDEAVLNMISGAIGVIIMLAVFLVVHKIKLAHKQPV